jgi:hypothetical protein
VSSAQSRRGNNGRSECLERHNWVIASFTFPRAASQGEERAATSKTRRRRSDTSGTLFFAFGHCSSEGSARSVASPPARRTLIAARSSLAALPARSGHPVVCQAARSRAKLRCASRAASGRARQQHGPRRAPPAPSLLPSLQPHDLSLKGTKAGRKRNSELLQLSAHSLSCSQASVAPLQSPAASKQPSASIGNVQFSMISGEPSGRGGVAEPLFNNAGPSKL